MFQAIKNLLGFGSKIDYKSLIQNGAQIIDVRTRNEYQGGHIRQSVNIPLDMLAQELSKLDKSKVIITCCASGMRSASAKSLFKSKGFTEVHNGGGWQSLQNKIK